MKKRLAVLLALISATVFAASTGQVRTLLEKALAGERDAIARYDAFAQKATEEGYPGAAALFRAEAAAERVHAQRFAEAMKARGMVVPPELAAKPNVWSTNENLRYAMNAETQERDGIYREGVDTARAAGDDDLATIFDQTRDTEVEHANLCNSAMRGLDKLKDAKAFYVCEHCGYTTDINLPMCPSCRHAKRLQAIE